MFSDAEIALVRNLYPGLARNHQGRLTGVLTIDAQHETCRIRDSYEVEIGSAADHPNRMPFLREIGGRTQRIAAKYQITDLRTLHVNPNGTACVCVRQEEQVRFPPSSDLNTFIQKLAVPYLYGLSFYDDHGRWPWKEYSHGGLGILEFYAQNTQGQPEENVREAISHLRTEAKWKSFSIQVRKPSPDKPCLCGSGKPFRKCHPDA